MVASLFSGIAALFGRRPTVDVRPLEPASSEPCAALHRRCFAHSWSGAEFERLATSPTVLADGAYVEGSDEIVGFVLSRIAAGEAEVLTIAVDPALRGQGVGRRLLEAHIGALVLRRVDVLFLEVEETNAAALALYARLGFQQIGRREGYYKQGRDTAVAALTMRKPLAQERPLRAHSDTRTRA